MMTGLRRWFAISGSGSAELGSLVSITAGDAVAAGAVVLSGAPALADDGGGGMGGGGVTAAGLCAAGEPDSSKPRKRRLGFNAGAASMSSSSSEKFFSSIWLRLDRGLRDMFRPSFQDCDKFPASLLVVFKGLGFGVKIDQKLLCTTGLSDCRVGPDLMQDGNRKAV